MRLTESAISRRWSSDRVSGTGLGIRLWRTDRVHLKPFSLKAKAIDGSKSKEITNIDDVQINKGDFIISQSGNFRDVY